MIKTRGEGGTVMVTFTLDAQVQAEQAVICGDWNGWSADRDAMRRSGDGAFSHTVELEAGRTYRFRYLLDGVRWENDWAADDYVPNDHGGDDSLVDLTATADEVPAAVKGSSGPAKKASVAKQAATPVKKAAPKKAATTAKKAAPKKAGSTKRAAPKKAAD